MKFCLFISFLFVLLSCKDRSIKQDFGNQKVIFLENVDKTIPCSEFVSEITYTPLETAKESLIGEIIKVKIYDNIIYILNQTGENSNIKTFSSSGDYLGEIGRIGNGPEEILRPRDFVINNDIIFVWDIKGVHSFTLNGSYLKFMFNAFLAGNKFFYDSEFFYFFHELNIPGVLSQYNIKGTLKKVFIPLDFGFGNSESSRVIKIENTYHLFTPSIDTVYTFSKNKLMPKYVIKYNGISSFGEILLSHKQMNPYELLQLINKTDHAFISTYIENDKYLFLLYWFNNAKNTVIINKKTWDHKYFKQIFNDIDGGLFGDARFITQNDELIIPLNSFDILEHIKKNQTAVSQNSPFRMVSKNLSLTSNPVLMICKIKDMHEN